MKKLIIIALLFFVTASFNTNNPNETYVYICKSNNSTRYHYDKNCRGLKQCDHKIEKVTLKQAQKIGRTLCKWED